MAADDPRTAAPSGDRPRLRVGRIGRPHGLAGEVVVRGCALDEAGFRALGAVTLVRESGGTVTRLSVRSVRALGSDLGVCFEGVQDEKAASDLRGLWIETERAALPEAGAGQVYHHDLLGLEVVDQDGRALGRVTNVLVTGAHEVLEVSGAHGEILVPYHAGTVLGWDPAAGRLDVRLPSGLEDVYRPREPKAD